MAIACAALSFGLLATRAAAFHIPGADYSGYASGGSISFSVSRDGSSVTNLTLTGVHANDCTLGSRQYSPIPISNNAFSNGEVSGDFPNVRGAYGHLSVLVAGPLSSCRIAGTWSATTGANPSGSAECKKALRKTHELKRAIRRAEKSGSARKLRKLQGKWRKARAKKDQFCG